MLMSCKLLFRLQLISACATAMRLILKLCGFALLLLCSCQDVTGQKYCKKYTKLRDADRRMSFRGNVVKCDLTLSKKWYRFTVEAGSVMSTTCVPINRCGTRAPGWLNGQHPTVAEGIVTRQVCYHWSGECCKWSNNIRIRNCGKFYVYELVRPPACHLRYCGAPGIVISVQPNSECQSHAELSEADRRMSFTGNVVKCDFTSNTKWYRFTGAAGSEMSTTCVPINRCGTRAPGWLKGQHPTVAEGIVTREVCYHWSGNCCKWSNNIRIRNCGKFYVYELVRPPACHSRYCGAPGLPVPTARPNSECQSYTELNEVDRSMTFSGNVVKCDRTIVRKWYRFTGTDGSEMSRTCVPINRCGTHAPGWLNGQHPTVAEGIVTREVCYHWNGECCKWSNNIRIRNCGKFFVYQLVKPPACHLRYCGAPSGYGSACFIYTKLDGSDRAVGNAGGPYQCDRHMEKKWYRFDGGAGDRMPENCPEPLRCGTHAPGWLHGKHPLLEDGLVQREVCFHWNSDCCRWKKQIQVRNCGKFYVYLLEKPPSCNLRYCGI